MLYAYDAARRVQYNGNRTEQAVTDSVNARIGVMRRDFSVSPGPTYASIETAL